MKTLTLLFSAFLLCANIAKANEAPFTVVCNDASVMADARAFDFNPRGNLVIQTSRNLYDVGAQRFLLETPRAIDTFAFMMDGTLMAVSGKRLAYYNTASKDLVDGIELPAAGLKLAADASDSAFAYGGPAEVGGVYRFLKGGKYLHVLGLGGIETATALRGRLFFAKAGAIFSLRSGEPIKLVVNNPALKIISLAWEPFTGTLLFSTADDIYVTRDGRVAKLIEGLGGPIKLRNGKLYVLSPQAKALVRLDQFERTLANVYWDARHPQ